MMRKLLVAAAVALVPVAGFSKDFDESSTAQESDDFASALGEWKLLEEQSKTGAQFNFPLVYAEVPKAPPPWTPKKGKVKPLQRQILTSDKAANTRWEAANARRSRLAAEQGDASAQYNLGVMYERGQGVLKDYVAAHMWYNIAHANGQRQAWEGRRSIAKKMTPAEVSEAQKRARVCTESSYQDCD